MAKILTFREDEETIVAYFPLRSLLIKVNESGAYLIKKLKSEPIIGADEDEIEFLDYLEKLQVVNGPEDIQPDTPRLDYPMPTATTLLLTHTCNLKCQYCYANAEPNRADMSFHVARAAIDTIIDNVEKRGTNQILVGFHGGGEPTQNWDVLVRSVTYAKRKTEELGIQCIFSLCSNGVFSETQALFIAEHFREINISLDGLPEIQNFQRPMVSGGPSFDRVARTLDLFQSRNTKFGIRATVTDHSIDRFIDSYKFMVERFRPNFIGVEPLFFCGRCETAQVKRPDMHDFIEKTQLMMDLAHENGIRSQYSGSRLGILDNRFCGAAGTNFFITPTGDVTSCLEVSSRDDPKADVFIYGTYNEEMGRFDFNIEKFKRLVSCRVDIFDSCSDCFAKFHCGGDCLAKSPDVSKIESTRDPYRCTVNRTIIKHQLWYEMNRKENAFQNAERTTVGRLRASTPIPRKRDTI